MATLQQHGAITVLRPSEPLRSTAIESLGKQLEPIISEGLPYLVLDMAETPLIDGAGLEWLLDLDETCCRRGGSLRLCNLGELCQDILRITGVGSDVQQFEDLTSALASFA